MSEQCHQYRRVTHPADVLPLWDDIARGDIFALRDDVVRTDGLLARLLFYLYLHHRRPTTPKVLREDRFNSD
jgi:hypothetical protein